MRETEAPLGVIKLRRGDAKVEQHALKAGGGDAICQRTKIDGLKSKAGVLLHKLLRHCCGLGILIQGQ